MTAYYNEIDPYAAQWLRNLILQGHLPRGDVDERSITEVSPDDLRGYTQCHFFAGIGGWSLALRMAGWDDSRPVWSGSCPCQPFSAAGKQQGKADARHLWPVWFRLIRECRPSVVFGEQVAAAIAHGWLDEAAHDLEGEEYTFAAAVLPACSVGAPHRRDRLWFVADASGERRQQISSGAYGNEEAYARRRENHDHLASGDGKSNAMDHTISEGLEGLSGHEQDSGRWASADGSTTSTDTAWLECPDGKTRPAKSGIRLLAYGVPARVAKLRAGGNAIVPQVAAEFIKAYDGVAA